MKKLVPIWLLVLVGCGFKDIRSKPENLQSAQNIKSIYEFTLNDISGEPISFEEYRGKKLLLVNVASECGFTYQYEDLQKLHEAYGNQITILGFPANNFGGQEPGTNQQIATFCKVNYGVEFQMFEKISVKGDDMHELYQWLSEEELNGWNNKAPNWNFCKYLINEKGELTNFFASAVKPMSEDIISVITN